MQSSIQFFKPEFIHSLISYREDEEKLGQTLHISQDGCLNNFEGRFVLLGISEDIGIRANYGIGGAASAFYSFLNSFVNLQNANAFNGSQFLLLGQIDTEEFMLASQTADITQLRELTQVLDDLIFPVIQHIVSAGKIPIVIGGGHNNAFPILKGCSLALGKAINTINLDAHSDFRIKEGRHSGNGYRYAYDERFLKKYALLGLHEAYNDEHILKELVRNPDLLPILFEDVFLREKESWQNAQQRAIDFVKENLFGVELDADSLENTLSSAWSPVGISATQSLNYLYNCGRENNVCYLHIAEAVYKRTDGMKSILVGKLLNYMVQAFCKGVGEQ